MSNVLFIEKVCGWQAYFLYTKNEFGEYQYIHKNGEKKHYCHDLDNKVSWDVLTHPLCIDSAYHSSISNALAWANKMGYKLQGCGL